MEQSNNIHRRLAAILAADIAGYSRLMCEDEAGTVRALKDHQAVVLPLIEHYHGRVIDTAGDGILAEFASVIDAVECGVEVQQLMARRNAEVQRDRRMLFRMGINLGDVIYDQLRIYGDGINVAARLQAISMAGGLCVSSKVRDEVLDRMKLEFVDLGDQNLKNIARPVHVYEIRLAKESTLDPGEPVAASVGPNVAVAQNASDRRLPTDLLGRDADIEALIADVGIVPLVTIVGTGGVGKTSLAKAVIARCESARRPRVCWIDLAPLREEHQFIALVAKSLGMEVDASARALEELVTWLSRFDAIITVDNCEHMLATVRRFVGQAVQGAPGIRWFATSQEPLHVAGEVVYRLAPLGVPAPDVSISDAMSYGSVALLCKRAAAGDRHFRVDASTIGTAIEVCRQLDGLPLAIEIAAARVASLGLQVVHEQLGKRLRLSSGPRDGLVRHHSLKDTFDWSYGLLSPSEQWMFRRLGVFLGGFRSTMAQDITRHDDPGAPRDDYPPALETLGALVDKSLVHRTSDASDRFYLLESARDYACDQLSKMGEIIQIQRAHASVVARWFEAAHVDYVRLADKQWNARYLPEYHNVRAALASACEMKEPDLLASLVAALAQIDSFNHRQAEVVQFDIPLDVIDEATPALRAAAFLELSWSHYSDGSRKTGTELALRALESFKTIGDVPGTYRALAQLVRLYESRPGMQDEADHAQELLRQIDARNVPLRTRLFCSIIAGSQYGRTIARLKEQEEIAHHAGFEALAAACRTHITDELLIEGRFSEAVEEAQRFRDAGELRPRDKALILNNQALALVQLGRVRDAYEPSQAALRALPSCAHIVVDTFALAAAREGRFVDASLMYGYGATIRRERQKRSDPAEAAVIAETGSRLKEALGETRLEELMHLGSAMKAADVLTIAMPVLPDRAMDDA